MAKRHSMLGGMVVFEWVLGDATTGEWMRMPAEADRAVHVVGTIGGATVTVEGSCQPTTPTSAFTLHDSAGNAATFTAADVGDAIMENTPWVRVKSAGGDGTSLQVFISMRKPQK